MNNLSTDSTNKKFSKVQEELKRLLSIIMYTTTIDNDSLENGFDSIIANSNNSENIKIAKYLKQETLQREERIKRQGLRISTNKTQKQPQISKPNTKTVSKPSIKEVDTIIKDNKEKGIDIEL